MSSLDSDEGRPQTVQDVEAPLTIGTDAEAKLDEQVGLIPSRISILTVGFALALLALSVFGWLAENVYDEEATILDDSFGPYLHGLSAPALDTAMRLASLVGSILVIGPLFVLVAVWLIKLGRAREALFLAVALVGGVVLNQTMKVFFRRPRPVLSWAEPIPEYSFPSGHAMNSFNFYASLAVVAWVVLGQRRGIAAFCAAFVIVFAVGVSRIYLGHHYFSDVLGGYSAGLLWLLISVTAVLGRRKAHSAPSKAQWTTGTNLPANDIEEQSA